MNDAVKALVHDAPPFVAGDDSRPNPPDDGEAAAPAEPTELFRVIDMAALSREPEQAQAWQWDGYVPVGHVTLLGGHGGAGKSTMALHVAACVGMGVDAFGRATKRARVLYFSAEDPADLVLNRLRRIGAGLGFPLEELQQWVQVVDASDFEPVLFAERQIDGVRRGVTTATHAELDALVRREKFGLVVVDGASDTFDTDEVRRALVRAFVRALGKMIRAIGGAVLLLAHVDKVTARGSQVGAEAYSGSTAWHNSVRSRLFLLQPSQPSAGELELQHQKCNVGPKLPPLRIEWPAGGVMRAVQSEQPGPLLVALEAKSDTKVLLRLMHEFAGRGEHVTTATTSRSNAALLLANERTFPKHLKAPDVFDLLRDAERKALIRREQYKGADRKPRERWTLTPQGLSHIGAVTAATAATAKTNGVTAAVSPRKEPAATAVTSPPGGMGGESAHKSVRWVTLP